ncbi:hypothetical protein HYW55_06455 [Candidatus Gottesmanbacteria bacterium]|nr:hypothetical protein [Candidatus Gottesmanbacteria bacterium]
MTITPNQIVLIVLIILFAMVGGMVDTYASYKFFPPKRKPPLWFSHFFLVWWLIIFVISFPFLFAYVASGYSPTIIKMFVTFGILASVVWDLIFSKMWAGKWISDSCKTWFWVGKRNLGFTKKTVIWLHTVRILVFAVLFYTFFIRVS